MYKLFVQSISFCWNWLCTFLCTQFLLLRRNWVLCNKTYCLLCFFKLTFNTYSSWNNLVLWLTTVRYQALAIWCFRGTSTRASFFSSSPIYAIGRRQLAFTVTTISFCIREKRSFLNSSDQALVDTAATIPQYSYLNPTVTFVQQPLSLRITLFKSKDWASYFLQNVFCCTNQKCSMTRSLPWFFPNSAALFCLIVVCISCSIDVQTYLVRRTQTW